ncbi:CPBP family intramembrane glutamic endopeptidase [Deinococcus enclensis]|uniref:Membrane protease YdiL (CAAX protease family) n=1 Tax=Deinococcus enclensis TaxID=1049582 RepID=A0ABT9MJ23_9DEIO|nr:CPBP family intramembrane glutamic endopeptidase [Deinococcus enclensis]MDP9766572.1 membrane protease YdiL (CAAX protease family) [Deinococcus enclensis]
MGLTRLPSVRKPLVFLTLTFTLSGLCYFMLQQDASELFGLGLIASPAVSALFTQLLFERTLRGLGWTLRAPRLTVLAYVLPLLYGLVVYLTVWLTGLADVSVAALAAQVADPGAGSAAFLGSYAFRTATLGVLFAGITAFGEELGWRGLLVPELARRLSFTGTALISGALWTLWHAPAIVLFEYNNAGAPLFYGLACFSVMAVSLSFVLAWLRLRSGSVWPAVVLHASHNAFIQTLLNPLTVPNPVTPYVTGEFGLGLAVVTALLAWLAWSDRKNLPPLRENTSAPEGNGEVGSPR